MKAILCSLLLLATTALQAQPGGPDKGYTISPSVVSLPKDPKDSMPPLRPGLRKQPIYAELYGFFGAMNGSTDLSEAFTLRTFQFNGGFGASAVLTRFLTVKAEWTAGTLREADTLNRSEKLQKRNLSYRTSVNEFSGGVEFYPFLLLSQKYRYKEPLLKPYVMGGVGTFSFNPEAELNGQWYELQPLRLEGQGFPNYPDRQPYKLRAMSYQVGVGAKYDFDRSFNLKLDFVYRFTNTDYIDDVATRYIDRSDFYRYLPTIEQADLASKLYKRQYRSGNILSTGELRGSNRRNDGFYSFNVKLVFNLGRRNIYATEQKARGSLK